MSTQAKWWRGIGPGDTVYYAGADCRRRSGVVRISTPAHVVLNVGGRHGTPQVVNEANFMAHKPLTTKQRYGNGT